MKIRILTFEGCPNCEAAVSLVHEVLDELGIEIAVDHVQVHSESEAVENHFFGSPSVQIDGKDIEAERRNDVPLFGCRLYMHEGRRTGLPPKEMIVKAIHEARRSAG